MSNIKQYRQRLEALFNDIERISSNPAGDMKAILCEIEELRARMHELEASIQELEQSAEAPEPTPTLQESTLAEVPETLEVPEAVRRPSTPLLYEKGFVG